MYDLGGEPPHNGWNRLLSYRRTTKSGVLGRCPMRRPRPCDGSSFWALGVAILRRELPMRLLPGRYRQTADSWTGPTSRRCSAVGAPADDNPADINQDGWVDGTDLAILLGDWGCTRGGDVASGSSARRTTTSSWTSGVPVALEFHFGSQMSEWGVRGWPLSGDFDGDGLDTVCRRRTSTNFPSCWPTRTTATSSSFLARRSS